MKVAMYYNNHDVRLEEQEMPVVGDGEVLMQVMACGICGSDVMEWYRVQKAPRVLGHEVAGIVSEAGKDVRSWVPGERIVATHHVPCNSCRYCLEGHHSVCDSLRTTNFHPGGFSQYLRLPAVNVDRGLLRLPDELSFDEGTFIEPLGCAVRGQRFAGVAPGKSVLVIGSGIAGLLHIKLAKAQGCGPIFATDIHPYRTGFAKRVGADEAFLACPPGVLPGTTGSTSDGNNTDLDSCSFDSVNIPEMVKEANDGCPVDIVIVCAGAPQAMAQALESVDRGGTVLFFAPTHPDVRTEIDVWDLWKNEITLTTSYAAAERDLLSALALLYSGEVDVKDMITHRFPLAETQKGFELMSDAGESMKIIVEPWAE